MNSNNICVLAYTGPVCGVNDWHTLHKRIIGGHARTVIGMKAVYKNFLDSMTLKFRADMRPYRANHTDPVYVEVFAQLPPRMDLENITKPLFDALEAAGVIKNDRQIACYRVERLLPEAAPHNGSIVVTVWKHKLQQKGK